MSARRIGLVLVVIAQSLAGCVSDHVIGIELVPPRLADGGPDVPPEVVAFELRLYRVDDGEECPSLEVAASAAPFGELAHAQSFGASDENGAPIGEVPPGRWALSALARDVDCGVRLYGCEQIDVGVAVPAVATIELLPVTAAPSCGACRACVDGACDPIDAVCP